MTNYEEWQLEIYGNVLPEPIILPSGEMEGTNPEIERSVEWVNLQAELQLRDFDKD